MSAPGMKSGLEDKVEFEKRSCQESPPISDEIRTRLSLTRIVQYLSLALDYGTISGVPKLDQFHHPSKSSLDHKTDFSPQPSL